MNKQYQSFKDNQQPPLNSKTQESNASRRISAIIPTLGRPDKLQSCLAKLASQSIAISEVLVVHCGSDSDTQKVTTDPVLAEAGLVCHYFHVEECNAAGQRDYAIRHSKYDNLLLLDDDVDIESDWVEEMFRPIWSDSTVGATMGRIVNTPMESPTFLWRCYRWMFVKQSLRNKPGSLVGAVLPNGFSLEVSAPMPCEWLGGGVSAMTREAYQSVGGFAPYFSGSSPGEDLDLGYRLSRKWQVYYVPTARCIHSHAPSGREPTARHQYFSVRSRYAIQVAAMGRSRMVSLFHCIVWIFFQTLSEVLALRRGAIRRDFLHAIWGRLNGISSCLAWAPTPPRARVNVTPGHE